MIAQLGGLKSSDDARDFLGSGQTPGAIPTVFSPDYSALPIYNQIVGPGGQSACGGASGAKLQNTLLGIGNELSWRFVYALCKKLDGLPADAGTYGRTVMQVLQRYGVCSADLFPNDTSLSPADFADWTKIPQAAFVDGLARRIGPYARVTDLSPLGIKGAVFQNKAILVLKSPWTPASWTQVESHTGHFFVLDGYDDTSIRFSNSFGPGWHEHGEGRLEESDLETVLEAWIAYEPGFHHFFGRDLAMGMSGPEVVALQQALRLDGEFTYPANTGYYGNATRQAVLAFQTKYSLANAATIAGLSGKKVGPLTRSKLNELFNA